jgi:hypothetical protein
MTTKQRECEKFNSEIKAISSSMKGKHLTDIVDAIHKLATGITVTDDGLVPPMSHSKRKLTIRYPDGSINTLVMPMV